jgi:hypothetical protein
VLHHAVRVVAEGVLAAVVARRGEVHGDTPVQRAPVLAAVGGLEDAAAGHAEVEVPRVARVDQDRVQLAAVGRLVLVGADPGRLVRVVVEAGHGRPVDAAVVASEEALGRRARVPDARLAGVPRGQPEDVVDGAAARLAGREAGWGGGLFPGLAEVVAAKDRRAEVPLARRAEQRPAVARIEHRVVTLGAEEARLGEGPGGARGVGRGDPESLAGRDVELWHEVLREGVSAQSCKSPRPYPSGVPLQGLLGWRVGWSRAEHGATNG